MSQQMSEKAIVRDYFNTLGFDRWRRIYGEAEVNRVQKDIRKGHARTIDTVLSWLGEELSGQTICDAGCGVGSLSIPLAKRGASVVASDISEKMVGEARERQQTELGQTDNPQFSTSDLEDITGSYDTVICLDVMIHYPEDAALDMIQHLTMLANDRVIFSFAPKTPVLSVLKKIGEFFPGPSKTTRAYQHREKAILERLQSLGWTVDRRETIKSQFYFSWILE
ncbi:MAG: magnesium protoporphyrin IX methyltransferase, partial [Cyanobacteria bacterium P01_F01_bin.3]